MNTNLIAVCQIGSLHQCITSKAYESYTMCVHIHFSAVKGHAYRSSAQTLIELNTCLIATAKRTQFKLIDKQSLALH